MIDFNNREETFFISYEDVIKSSAIKVLESILLKYSDTYKEFIDHTLLINHAESYDAFVDFFIIREHSNIFDCLKKFDFDTLQAWKDIHKRNENLYKESMELPFANSLYVMPKQKFTKMIYLWTEEYDERIHRDISESYGFIKINYVVGPFEEAIMKVPDITCYVLNDINLIYPILLRDKIKFTNIMLANYRYNMVMNEDKGFELKIPDISDLECVRAFKLLLFNPIRN
jgi:hypothetical protein